MRPKIGYLLPTRDWTVLGNQDLSALIEQARLAEQLGFDSVWAGDSPVTRPRADALMMLAAVAATTNRITLGTAVLLPALRHPLLLAHQLATLDGIADGRLIVGMGGGFAHPNTEAQFEALGVGFKRRISRMEESVDIMRRLWTGETVSHQGEHFAFHDVTLYPKPVQAGGPPIWLPGSGERALRRAARLADGWLPYPPTQKAYAEDLNVLMSANMSQASSTASTSETSSTASTAEAWSSARASEVSSTARTPEAWSPAGTAEASSPAGNPEGPPMNGTCEHGSPRASAPRPFTPALYATICLDDDPERARHRLRTSIERYYNAPLEFVESIQAMFAGTPEEAANWLNGYIEEGARHVVIRLAVDDHRAAMEEFAAQVLPRMGEI
ncbi:LLM class flavin-dependent oxidoreductase [Nonomuraea jabiensis]|uniref:Putative F420-dependent oxidoreductase n=1 Tax=Nonomuraea jabiensis TaxID=882448 RepID=A0A7W9LAP8_9ACTN|nr:LLM class flavin-dependent oxidoreductase [Nonomuraea jabiensis]MBB5776905.1 putative F420-dependent oxidoreductase [Nonomuraea jabiensis]